jgi:2,3-dihydro-2,3-dihydroxybenzoate dehydrogenase
MIDKQILPGKTVLISGAAGGLGKVLVKQFAGYGYKVIAVDIDAQGLECFLNMDHIMTNTLDITDPEQVKSLISENGLDINGLDILLCLAGIYDTYPVTEAAPDHFKKIIDINLLGTASMIQAMLKPLIRNRGRVIVVSSESYKIQAMFQPYMISKAALEAYCRVARQELALKGVILIVIRPGAIRTPLLNWMKADGDPDKYPVYEQEFRTNRARSVKMVGRISSPESVAQKIFLASRITRPKRVYRINNNPFLSLIALLPPRIFDTLVVWITKHRK